MPPSTKSSRSSSTSSRSLSPQISPRRGLLCPSPPPISPDLPSLLPRHGKRESSRQRLKARVSGPYGLSCWRISFSIFAVVVLTYVLLKSFIRDYQRSNDANYDLVDTPHLPDEPTSLIVTDHEGRKKWTVWIPPSEAFPLRPHQYVEMCAQAEEVQRELSASGWFGSTKKGYYVVDPNFVEVEDALGLGFLPSPDEQSEQSLIAEELEMEQLGRESVCDRSLTFVMETDDAGMGNSLLAMWLAYGLAKKENRAFFVDDTYWPYGKFSAYFKPPPSPACRQPAAHYRLPCPRSASHLVISAATFSYTFGPTFLSEFLDPSRPHEQHHKIFSLVREGYEALFHIADSGDAAYVHERTTGKIFQEAKNGGGMTVGLHVRRGDLHPWESQFHNDYLPLTRYMDEVRDILITKYEHEESEPHSESPSQTTPDSHVNLEDPYSHLTPFSTFAKPKSKIQTPSKKHKDLLKRHGAPGLMASKLLLSSDDPLTYNAPDVSRAIRAQERIVLASKADLNTAASPAPAGKKPFLKPWLDTVSGWEGGFFKDVFFGLGQGQTGAQKPPERSRLVGRATSADSHDYFAAALTHELHHSHAHAHTQWRRSHGLPPAAVSPAAMSVREIVGRAYLLDLAVLGQTDAVVCAVSSAACRVLGVMVGWDKVRQGEWRNVDGEFGWTLRGVIGEY